MKKDTKTQSYIISLLSAYFNNSIEQAVKWFMTPCSDFDNVKPIDLVKKGKEDIIFDFLEDGLLGHPN